MGVKRAHEIVVKRAIDMSVRVGDIVQVNAGKHKGDKGRVRALSPQENRVIVEGIHVVVKHVKKQKGTPGKRVVKQAGINRSNIQLYCEKCDTGVRHSVKVAQVEKKLWDGSMRTLSVRSRLCRKCGGELVWSDALMASMAKTGAELVAQREAQDAASAPESAGAGE
jgi:large subunit ribosomal protein L24